MAEKANGGFKPKIIKRVTLPLFKWQESVSRYYRIDGKIFRGKEIKGTTSDGTKMEPADLMHVTDLETGEVGEVIVGAVLGDRLKEEYPGDKYVGRCFSFTQHKVEGKRWKDWEILEIAAPEGLEPLDEPAKATS